MACIRKLSNWLAIAEMWMAALLAALLSVLILLNVVSRALGMAIYWVDELAIYAMVWMTFLATSVVIKRRQTLSVTLIVDLLPTKGRVWLGLFSDLMVLLFAGLLLVFCIRWFDPFTLYQHGFDSGAFQMQTFNFIYAESTNTLGLKKFWIWLALPFVAVTLLLHASVNLLERCSQLLKRDCADVQG